MVKRNLLYIWLLGCIYVQGCGTSDNPPPDTLPKSWEKVLEQAKGEEITMMMWQGDPLINKYMETYIKRSLKDSFGIDLTLASGQGNAIIQSLMAERQAGKEVSSLDIIWINGETFYQLRELDGLFGPFVEKLPNSAYLDLDNPFIGKDFQQDIKGYECPWGNVQLTWIYDNENLTHPPQNRRELYQFVKQNPGIFTFDSHFTGMTWLKSLMIDMAGDPEVLYGAFDEEKYSIYSARLWDYIDSIRPYLWKEGRTIPTSVASMHQMFANNELWFTFSNNDAEVDNKVIRGVFDTTARAYVPEIGSIQNSHYLGIPKMSGKKAAAMVAINFMISPEAQYKKMSPEIWGDGTVLDISKLPLDWQNEFENIPGRKYAPDRKEIEQRAYMELAPEYMIRLYDDLQKYISGNLQR